MNPDEDFDPYHHVPPEHVMPAFVQSLEKVPELFWQFYERADGGYRRVPDGRAKAGKLVFDPDKFSYEDPTTWNKMRWVGQWPDPPAKT